MLRLLDAVMALRETLERREAGLNEREVDAAAREARVNDRADDIKEVLADADRRDERADARDLVADEREHAASLDAFVHPNDQHDAAMKARRSSAIDRSDLKSERTSSADGRSRLSDG